MNSTMMGSRCNPITNPGDEYIGVTSRPEVFDTICGDEAFQALNSAFSAEVGTETMVVPAESYDMMFNLDTRVRGAGLSFGSTFDEQLQFGTERLPRPEDVVGATLDDHKVGVGFITSNSKDFPVTDIQTLRPYIPAPVTVDGWGSIGVATKGAFGQMITDNTFLMDPRFTWPTQGIDVHSTGIYGFPEVSTASSLGVWGESGAAPRNNLWGAPGSSSMYGL
eukprot:jgi/Mesvir1/24161/Mv10878-RA.1